MENGFSFEQEYINSLVSDRRHELEEARQKDEICNLIHSRSNGKLIDQYNPPHGEYKVLNLGKGEYLVQMTCETLEEGLELIDTLKVIPLYYHTIDNSSATSWNPHHLFYNNTPPKETIQLNKSCCLNIGGLPNRDELRIKAFVSPDIQVWVHIKQFKVRRTYRYSEYQGGFSYDNVNVTNVPPEFNSTVKYGRGSNTSLNDFLLYREKETIDVNNANE